MENNFPQQNYEANAAAQFANAIKEKKTAIGEVYIDNVSPIEHSVNVKIESLNLIKFPYMDGSCTKNGLNFTVNDDGSVYVQGTSTAVTYFNLWFWDERVMDIEDSVHLNGMNQSYFSRRNYTVSDVIVQQDQGQNTRSYLAFDPGVIVDKVFYPTFQRGDNPDVSYTQYVAPQSVVVSLETSYGEIEYTPDANGRVEGVTSIYPVMRFFTQNDVVISCEYNADSSWYTSKSRLRGKKIVYDGDSICQSRLTSAPTNEGGYPKLIADITGCTYENFARSGAMLIASNNSWYHSVVDNLENLPADADLFCFEGGYNEWRNSKHLGACTPDDYTGELDTSKLCGALETIFRYCMSNFPGTPICYVILHKPNINSHENNSANYSLTDMKNAIIEVCNKYSVPYYNAFDESGFVGQIPELRNEFTMGSAGLPDGLHPNAKGYRRYYVPQLIDLFERILPFE